MRALCFANGYFFDISLFGSESNKNLEFFYISSTFKVGKTRLLLGNSCIGQISAKSTSPWRASIHHGVQQGRQCAGHLAKIRNDTYLEYTQNLVPQHQDEDAMDGKRKKEERMTRKRVENIEGSLEYPGVVTPVFTKHSKPLGKIKRSLRHLRIVPPVLT
ncbi:hypothetical protein TNCV_4769021 [Trichonephila clavipes]|nr:hypothetical protein TNCV_4769021 [Trichonephila clavipes]